MNITELFASVLPERHHEIVTDNRNHVFFDGKEYLMNDYGCELTLIQDTNKYIISDPPEGASKITNLYRDGSGKLTQVYEVL